jgi:spoIIIJ-associated protein
MAKKTENNQIIEKIKKISLELLENLDVKAEVAVEEIDDFIKVNISSEEQSSLIGYHGKNLLALQTIISQIAYRQIGADKKVLVDVDDYREQRQEQLKSSALELAERVKSSGKEQRLVPMSSFERRIIHVTLSDDQEIETFSEGEGQERHIVIKPRK